MGTDLEHPVYEETLPGFHHVVAYRVPTGGLDVLVWECASRRGEPVRFGQCVYAARLVDGRWVGSIGKLSDADKRRLAGILPTR